MNKHVLSAVSFAVILIAFPMTAMSEYVFAAPPRESVDKGNDIYQPVAEFLSKKTGEKFVYRHPRTWSEYSKGMVNNEVDLYFNGPHFVSWCTKNIDHSTVAKLPQLLIWRIVTRSDNARINSMDDLVGKKVCAPKSPNFGMLTMMSHFSNPDRQPVHIVTKGWKDGFNGVVQGKCEAAVIPKTNHRKFDPKLTKTRAIHTHLPYPNQAITAGPKLSSRLKSEVKKLLLSGEGQEALSKVRDRFSRGAELVDADNEEYEGISLVLKRAGNFMSAAKQ